jgi:16S rRNA processing protein RimM
MSEDEWLAVGVIVAAQGVDGEVRVRPLTDFPERLTRRGLRRLSAPGGRNAEVMLQAGRQLPGKNLFVCRFDDFADRNTAEVWVGAQVEVRADVRPTLAEGEVWLPDLLGAAVIRRDSGERIGAVRDLRRAGNDLLVVALTNGREILIPFVAALVPEVDTAAGWVIVEPLPGLLDPDEAQG